MVKSTQEKPIKGKERKTSQAKAFINPSPAKSFHRVLTKQAGTKLKTIQNKITTFATHKGISPAITTQIISRIKKDVENASDQKKEAMKILENIKVNQVMANTIPELIGSPLPPTAPPASIAGPSSSQQDTSTDVLSEPSTKSSKSSSLFKMSKEMKENLKKQLEARKSAQVTTPRTSIDSDESYYMDVETGNEERDVATIDRYMKNLDITEENEPVHITHMKNIVKLMNKHPDVKSEINKTLLEMYTKAKIKPEQYEILRQHIDTKEQPQTIRVKKEPKPRAKKSAQTDKAIIPMEIETISKLPKGKNIKDNQKKKPKIVTL